MKRLRVLVACEFSGRVRAAFRRYGHDAWSCDLLPALDESAYHYQTDVRNLLTPFEPWDLLIAFPPCTHLAVSGAHRFAEKRKTGEQQRAVDFFLTLAVAPIPHRAMENPVGIMSRLYRKPDQYFQPWQFGHPESKKTGLWLTNLPPLRPTQILPLPASGRWDNQTPSGQNKLGPSPDRALRRGLTYQGVAEAMAEQWSAYLEAAYAPVA